MFSSGQQSSSNGSTTNLGDILLPMSSGPFATQQTQFQGQKLTTDVDSSLALAATNLSLELGGTKGTGVGTVTGTGIAQKKYVRFEKISILSPSMYMCYTDPIINGDRKPLKRLLAVPVTKGNGNYSLRHSYLDKWVEQQWVQQGDNPLIGLQVIMVDISQANSSQTTLLAW